MQVNSFFVILCKRNLYLSQKKVVVMQLGEKCVNMRVMRKRLFGKKQIIIGYQSRAIRQRNAIAKYLN